MIEHGIVARSVVFVIACRIIQVADFARCGVVACERDRAFRRADGYRRSSQPFQLCLAQRGAAHVDAGQSIVCRNGELARDSRILDNALVARCCPVFIGNDQCRRHLGGRRRATATTATTQRRQE